MRELGLKWQFILLPDENSLGGEQSSRRLVGEQSVND